MTLGQQSIVRDGAKLAQVRAAHMELLKLAQAGDLNGELGLLSWVPADSPAQSLNSL